MDWDKRSVLITGGNGFIGANLIHRLINMDVPMIRVIDNMERDKHYNLNNINEKVEFIQGDLRDKKVCLEACKDIDIVFHFASKVGGIAFYKEYAADVLSYNISIDMQMLEAARKTKIRRYIYLSSAYVYPLGRMQDPYSIPISEAEAIPAQPAISYGWAKLIGETALQYTVEQDQTMKGVILRLSNVYGPYQSMDLKRGSIIPVLIRRAIEYPNLKPYLIYGAGEETRSYCYISDALDALCQAVEKLSEYQLIGPLNIGSEDRIRIIDLAGKIIDISGKKIKVERKKAPPPVLMSQTLDCSQANLVLAGLKTKVTIDEGLQKMYTYVNDKMNFQ